ncbi:uncharacterized protein LOC114543333, partial [Dendronephthya gigantea]|uniref:uncharacterized protein LOC114543333 n=1 Tax=Dendronephthya gigantea TaxID=151771 RepID=UPI00106ABD6B
MTQIEIVVPDLTNNEQDPNHKRKFYKYILLNHTSCKCGELEERKLYNTSSNNLVSESYFLEKYRQNAKNLQSHRDFCTKTQTRYKLTENHLLAKSSFKYLRYKQCLPFCAVRTSQLGRVYISFGNGETRLDALEDDLTCEAYDNTVSGEGPFCGSGNPFVQMQELQKEVVSIYNDEFTTPSSRYPYFIEVYRCVETDSILALNYNSSCYPVQKTMTEIEIVVPDLTNNKRDSSRKRKFYKYMVLNHTSCKCGRLDERNLYNTSSNNL